MRFLKDRFFYLPAMSSFLLALSRYPNGLNFLVFFAFIPIFFLIDNPIPVSVDRRKILKAALTFSTGYTVVSLYWITVVTFPGFIGLLLLFGFYFLVFFAFIFLVRFVLKKYLIFVFFCSWLTFEWLQNFGAFRFPWFNISYALAEYIYLIQLAEYGGITLLSALVLLINIMIYYSFKHAFGRIGISSLLAAVVVMIGWVLLGGYRYKNIVLEEQDFTAAIVQVSIPQYIKWDETFYEETLSLYRQYTLEAAKNNPDLIIFPEAAIPDYVLQSSTAFNFITDLAAEVEKDIFLGFPHYEIKSINGKTVFHYYNSATVIRQGEKDAPVYYKNILVPFGERIPFMEYVPLLRKLDFGQANFEYGEGIEFYTIKKDENSFRYSPLICYEIIFPAMSRKIVQEEVDFVINITNDAWFKRTIGPYQHGIMTVIRAVETRTQYYRAANSGISLIVDPRGKIIQQTNLFDKTVIQDNLYIYTGQTLYVRFAYWLPAMIAAVTGLIVLWTFICLFSIKPSGVIL